MQQREIDAVSTDDSILAGLVEEDPYLHIVGPNMATQPYGIGVNLNNTGLGPVRQRHAGTHPPRRDVEHVVPQVVDGFGAGARPAHAEVCGLMAEATNFETPTTWVARRRDVQPGSQGYAQRRSRGRQATQALFRPDFDDDDDDDFPLIPGIDTEARTG